jgi:hypothetical protein
MCGRVGADKHSKTTLFIGEILDYLLVTLPTVRHSPDLLLGHPGTQSLPIRRQPLLPVREQPVRFGLLGPIPAAPASVHGFSVSAPTNRARHLINPRDRHPPRLHPSLIPRLRTLSSIRCYTSEGTVSRYEGRYLVKSCCFDSCNTV